MKESLRRILRFIGGGDFLIFLTIFFAGFIFLEKSGLFSLEPASYREIFHSLPSKGISILFTLNALAGLIFLSGEKSLRKKIGSLLFYISIIVLVAGLWVSIFTRFEGKALISEGQTLNPFIAQYVPVSVYMPDDGRLPNISITILKINPVPSPDMKKMSRVTADILFASKTAKGAPEKRLSSTWPLINEWTLIAITDFGYAPKYVLSGLHGEVLESEHVIMKLFPSGAEEYFEAMFLGYVFYLRYYPDYVENQGKPSTLSAYTKNPVFNLRIVRNKDIVYNGLLKPSEKVRFDNVIISVPEVTMWVEVSVVRDRGVPVIASGIAMMIVSAILIILRKK